MKMCKGKRCQKGAVVVSAFMLAGWLSYLLFCGNFYGVEGGAVYRSAQPSDALLQVAHDRFGVASVINLRGEHQKETWYRKEIAASQALGIKHYDLDFSATHEADLAAMERLVSVMEQAPKPVLIHCRGGADRTGLAVALYRYAIQNADLEEAQEALSLQYGHFPWLWSKTDAMDRSFERYVVASKEQPLHLVQTLWY